MRGRLVFIAPFKPHRGGIADHSTQLRQSLAERYELEAIGYHEPFPYYLYPGEHLGDLRKRDGCLKGVEYPLSWHWPGAWLSTSEHISRIQPNAVLVAWWTYFFAPHLWLLCRRLRLAKVPVVFLCHNLSDHEGAAWKRWISLRILSCAHALIFHSAVEECKARHYFPQTPMLVYPHPLYDHFPIPEEPELPQRPLRLLFFGFVRPYKGLEDLVKAMELLDKVEVHLTIAGEWWGNQSTLRKRCRRLEDQGKCQLIDRYLSDSEAGRLIAGSHALVLPYRKATNSGILAHALQARKPVIATETGALPAGVDHGKSGILVPPACPQELAKAIQELQCMIESGHDFITAIERLTVTMTWGCLAHEIESFLRDKL